MRDFLFANYPANAVHNITFAATVGTNDAGDVFIEVNKGFIGKAFKALNFQRF